MCKFYKLKYSPVDVEPIFAGVPMFSSASSPRKTLSSYSPIDKTQASYSFLILLTLCSKFGSSNKPVKLSLSPFNILESKSSRILLRNQCSRIALTSLTMPSCRSHRASTTQGLLLPYERKKKTLQIQCIKLHNQGIFLS